MPFAMEKRLQAALCGRRRLILRKEGPGALAEDRHSQGMKVRRSVLGDAHVDRAEERKTAFDADFQRLITETAWGSVWARPGLDKRERSLLTIAMLAALGHHEELAMHIRATRNTGASEDDVKETLLQVAIYAGVPAANTAIAIAKKVYAEMAEQGGRD